MDNFFFFTKFTKTDSSRNRKCKHTDSHRHNQEKPSQNHRANTHRVQAALQGNSITLLGIRYSHNTHTVPEHREGKKIKPTTYRKGNYRRVSLMNTAERNPTANHWKPGERLGTHGSSAQPSEGATPANTLSLDVAYRCTPPTPAFMFLWCSPCVCVSPNFLFCEDTGHTGLGAHPTPL